MPSPKKFEINDIEMFRQRLLERVLSENKSNRLWKREAVKRLLSALIAARESGMTFEAISEMARESGLDLPTETLRSYFFELKTESELSAERIRHAQKIAQTRESIQKQVLEKHEEHGFALAAKRARMTQAMPEVVNAFEGDAVSTAGIEQVEPHRPVVSRVERKEMPEHKTARPASPAAPVPPPAAEEPARFESERVVREPIADVKPASTLPTSEKANRAAPDVQSEGAMTLADIERASLATEERTELVQDVELRAGELVYYVSGQPFQGLLSQRQIHLLRRVGRIIAPTKGMTSKDFVSMPTKL
ncbi:hypothetical protein ACT2FY_39080 [Paraburkholderia fungorum]|uniref:hypothetical protein n=1 Tax=Paraburkholderia fungorum TaxID=134537 RepID=UPI00402B6364